MLELVVFAMFGAAMFVTRVIMAALPNIHLLGMFIMILTLEGVFAGFDTWWMPYLYIWTILWGITMLLPKRMPKKVGCIVYPIVCATHGLLFGLFYAPAYALFYGLTFEKTLIWIAGGTVFDILHCVGDFCAGFLVVPMVDLLRKLLAKTLK